VPRYDTDSTIGSAEPGQAGPPIVALVCWFSSVQAGAAQSGVLVDIEPVPGGTRFTCQLPPGFGR
jgi:hypothetical protein